MELNTPEIKESVRSSVSLFIDAVSIKRQEVPTRTVIEYESGTRHPRNVPHLLKLLPDYMDKREVFFGDSADLILESYSPLGEQNKRRDELTHTLLEFALRVADFNGELAYDDQAFEAAYDRWFDPLLQEGYSKTGVSAATLPSPPAYAELEARLQEFIIPVYYLRGLEEELELTLPKQYRASSTDQLTISPLSDADRSGIYTREYIHFLKQGQTFLAFDRPMNHKISIRSGLDLKTAQELSSSIATALRLYSDSDSPIHTGAMYVHMPDFLSYREDIKDVDSAYPSEFSLLSGAFSKYLDAGKEDLHNFPKFWKDNWESITLYGNPPFSTALRHFNHSFSREIMEDAFLDCMLSFESTLLYDLGREDTYSTEIANRGAQIVEELPDNSGSGIHKFFETIYLCRNQIVHEGKTLHDFLETDEAAILGTTRPKIAVSKTRSALKSVLRAYLNQESVEQANARMFSN